MDLLKKIISFVMTIIMTGIGTAVDGSNLSETENIQKEIEYYTYSSTDYVNSYIMTPKFNISALVNIYEDDIAIANYKTPNVIYDYKSWEMAILHSIYNMDNQLNLVINNYNKNVYSLNGIKSINTSISAEGTIKGTTANVTYKFNYTEDYKISKAAKSIIYLNKLNQSEINLFNQIKSLTNSIVNANMTEYEKEKAIHDYIVKNYRYDYSENANYEPLQESYSMRGLLNNGFGVCQAYSYLFCTMGRLAGLNCDIITGTNNNQEHAWNIVVIDGEKYHIDVTSDDPVPDQEGRVLYNYFNLNDNEILKTHTFDTSKISCVSTKYNYYIYNNMMTYSLENLKNYIYDKVSNCQKSFTFYTKGYVLNSLEDLKFIENYKNLKSYSISGKFGKEGAYYMEFEYR